MATYNQQQRSVMEADRPEWLTSPAAPTQEMTDGTPPGDRPQGGATAGSATPTTTTSASPSTNHAADEGADSSAAAGGMGTPAGYEATGAKASTAATAAGDDEATGVENVTVDNQPGLQYPGTPQTWQEAVDENFEDYNSRKYESVDDIADMMQERIDALHIPSEKELEKERRRRRTQGIISGIADAASAVSNLIFTTQYAPNMYNPADSMTGKWRERWDKLKGEREANADRALNYALKIHELLEAKGDKEYKRGRDALQDRLAQIRAENNARLSDIKYRLATQQLSAAQAAAEEREANRELERQIKEAKLDEINSRTDKNNRWQPTTGRGGGGTRSSQYFDVEDNSGEVRRINMSDLYDYYEQSDPAIKRRHRQSDSYGQLKTPTVNEMKQVVTEHIRTNGFNYRGNSAGAGTMPGVSPAGSGNKMPGVK